MNSSDLAAEYIPKRLMDEYNLMLQKKLEEATANLEQAVETLRFKNRELEIIYENVDFGIVERSYDDKTGEVIELVNQKALSIFGVTKEDYERLKAEGKSTSALVDDMTIAQIDASIDRASNDEPIREKFKAYRADGQEIWIAVYISKVTNRNGKTNVLFTIQDVTDEEDYKNVLTKKNEELLLSERLYEIAMNHTETIVFDYDIVNNRMTQSHNTMPKYGFPIIIDDPVNTIIASGAIHESSIAEFREMYRRIHEGEPCAKARINTVDINGKQSHSEISLTNIYGSEGKPIRAVGVLTDISEIAMLENERQYKESLTSDKLLIYEADITRNTIEYISKDWSTMFQDPDLKTYDDLVNYACINIIYGEDVDSYRSVASRRSIVESVEQQRFYQTVEYRRRVSSNSYTWVEGAFNIIRDEITGDIKVRCYISQIDNEKKKEIELLYKSEHDALTELFNRGALNQRIRSYLNGEGKGGKHAFLLFDIDMFKQINDNFGHSFGDAVLSQVSRKVRELFRDDDIIGRIGGDEFIILMKNVPSQKIALKKAKELCETVTESYTQNGKKYIISASVGIAMYKEHGMSYQKLYERSDAAMYAAKKAGRNNAMMYDRNMEVISIDNREAMIEDVIESKSFEKNIAEYVFKILYNSHDKNSAINSVLELIGKQYQVSRAYIFEQNANGLSSSNTFEWCNESIEEQKNTLQNIPFDEMDSYAHNFDENGVYYLDHVDNAPDEFRVALKRQDITSMLQFAITKNNEFVGFVGFDQCGFSRRAGKEELDELKNISNILGVFLIEMRALAANEATKNTALSIVNGLDSYAYVINKDTYELLFINDRTKAISSNTQKGDKCYSAFWNNETPCNECPMRELINSDEPRHTMVLYNSKFQITTKATASWINWTDGTVACLMDSVDITNYLNGKYKPKELLI